MQVFHTAFYVLLAMSPYAAVAWETRTGASGHASASIDAEGYKVVRRAEKARLVPRASSQVNFQQVYNSVCNGAFNEAPVNGDSPTAQRPWGELAFHKRLSRSEMSKLRTNSSGIQHGLMGLAQSIYFGNDSEVLARRKPDIWADGRDRWGEAGGAWGNAIENVSNNNESWFYIGVGKNGITTFNQFLEHHNWQKMRRDDIQRAYRPNLFYIARNPLERYLSGYLEVSTRYPKALPKQVADIEAADHFTKVFEMSLLEGKTCNADSVVPCMHSKWGWAHVAPQMWFLEWWFPHTQTNYAINVSFDLRKSDDAFADVWTQNMGHHGPILIQRENVKTDSILKRHATAAMKNATLQRAACAFYARDYFCLGYELPKACRQDAHAISRILFLEQG